VETLINHSQRVRDGKQPAAPTRDAVIAIYRLLLGREPESEDVIATAMLHPSTDDMVHSFLQCAEFRGRHGSRPRRMDERAAPIHVEWDVDRDTATRLIERVSETWTRLGEDRPYWSVLANPAYLPENVAGREQTFYNSGRYDLEILLATIRRVGRELTQFPVAFEFGCGLGRVTSHLCRCFSRVIACDISPSHLALARTALAKRGLTNVEFRRATATDFGISEPFDLWFNRIVLQHNPPPLIAAIISRALALLRPGGLAIFQVPVYLTGYRFCVEEYLRRPINTASFEMHALPQSAIFRIAGEQGCRLLEVREENSAGDPWISQFFTIAKV
jgi:SAM-dependent methyltransferase